LAITKPLSYTGNKNKLLFDVAALLLYKFSISIPPLVLLARAESISTPCRLATKEADNQFLTLGFLGTDL